MRNLSRPALVAGAVLAFNLTFLTGCGRSAAAGTNPPATEVGVAAVVSRQVTLADEFNGRVEAIQAVDIRPRVSGYIDRIAYAEGSTVKAGDLLFVIDPRPYRDALATAQARLESARAASSLSRSRFARAQKLIEAKAISREEFDTTQANLDQAAADLHAAEAGVSTARLNLGFTEVRAPVAGRVGRAMLTVGNLAQADQSLLTHLVSQDAMYVYFDCDEQSYLRYGADASRKAAAHVGLADEEGFPREGRVDFLDNRLDPATGTLRARAVVPNVDGKLVPGLYARVSFEGAGAEQARLIDDKAVLTDQDRRYVYVVDGGKAVRRDIQTGRRVDGLRIVRSGLSDGDTVVVSGAQKIYFSGMPVNAVPVGR